MKQPTGRALRAPLAGSPACVFAFVFVFSWVKLKLSSTPRPSPVPRREQKKAKQRSASKMKVQVMTIKTHTESSKSELSSRGKRLFKVSFKKTNERTNERTDVQPYRTNNPIGRRQNKLLRNFFWRPFFLLTRRFVRNGRQTVTFRNVFS